MRSRKVRAIECPECGEVHILAPGEKPKSTEAWYLPGDVYEDTALTDEEPEKVEAYHLPCEHLVRVEEVSIDAMYQCGECEEVYENREDARDCCKD